jgi:hypothetical protein
MLFLGFLPELGAERCHPEEKQDPQPDQGVLRGQGMMYSLGICTVEGGGWREGGGGGGVS